tara:strand:+ start:130540 stop:131796 length:1257 start_codon:yes stop_codon:yes gene_type:complete
VTKRQSRKIARVWQRFGFLFGVVVIAGVSVATWWSARDETMRPDDPPVGLTQSGADVNFVGTARCAECHPDRASDYRTTGHSRTFQVMEDSPIPSRLDGKRYVDPIRKTELEYRKEGAGLAVRIPEVLGDDPFPLQYVFGSGQHAFTFLTLIPGPGGEAIGLEHRVSLFSATASDRTVIPGGALGLTPGQKNYRINEEVDHFGHIVSGGTLRNCIRCHTTTGEIRGGEVINLMPNVGCESCHGPGSRHAEGMSRKHSSAPAALPRSVRKPGQMFTAKWSALDEIRMCGECHRMPEDISSDRISPYHPSTIRFQPIGLLKSRCYLESDKNLSCSGCHNPHLHSSSQSRSDYESKCISCHSAIGQKKGTSCPVSSQKNCIECHMSAVEIHPGVFFHDHWIRVRDGQTGVVGRVESDNADN